MLRYVFLAFALFLTINACSPPDKSPAGVLLQKVAKIMDDEKLDYAVATQLIDTPLDTSVFHTIVRGNEVASISGDYYIKRGRAEPPGFDSIRFDMAWQANNNLPATKNWHIKKGLRSSLDIGFDQENICISKSLLRSELGRGEEGRFSHGDSTTLNYGDVDEFLVSFTFDEPTCASSMSIIANNPDTQWPTPSDLSANDVEFVLGLLPLDKSGAQLVPLGMDCGPDVSPGSPEDTACGCDHEHQTRTGPCHHAVTISNLVDDYLLVEVFPLLNEEAN